MTLTPKRARNRDNVSSHRNLGSSCIHLFRGFDCKNKRKTLTKCLILNFCGKYHPKNVLETKSPILSTLRDPIDLFTISKGLRV